MIFAVRITVYGLIQGVGFRDFTVRESTRLGVVGYVENLPEGSVKVVAEGVQDQVKSLITELKRGPRMALVSSIHVKEIQPTGKFTGFQTH